MKSSTFYKRALQIALAIFSTVAFTSCQKDNPHMFKDKGWKPGNPLVFVAGSESNGVNSVAKCWINDQEITLSDGTNDATANSIFVAGNDSYIAGNDGGPVYWKNKTEVHLPSKSAIGERNPSANSIYVSGGHIYVAGQDGISAVYWKDGIEIILNTTNAYGNFASSGASSVFISGNDIYVAGYHGPNAVYWKNGVEVYISHVDITGAMYTSESAESIYVSGANVFVVGYESDVGALSTFIRYWKNGIDESSTLNHPNIFYGGASSVFVSGNNVYISGMVSNFDVSWLYGTVYWKDGNETVLSSNNHLLNASDIYVKGNDVYVSGFETNSNNNQTYAVYWKNGTEIKLTDGTKNAVASSIFVK